MTQTGEDDDLSWCGNFVFVSGIVHLIIWVLSFFLEDEYRLGLFWLCGCECIYVLLDYALLDYGKNFYTFSSLFSKFAFEK